MFMQPFAFVTVTVYVEVIVGFATGLEIAVLLRPVAGLHEYCVPPVALSCVLLPWQTLTLGPALAAGSAFTVTVTESTFMQPLLSDIITVYVVVTEGEALVDDVVVEARPEAGLHE
jgi:hypothetical protein